MLANIWSPSAFGREARGGEANQGLPKSDLSALTAMCSRTGFERIQRCTGGKPPARVSAVRQSGEVQCKKSRIHTRVTVFAARDTAFKSAVKICGDAAH